MKFFRVCRSREQGANKQLTSAWQEPCKRSRGRQEESREDKQGQGKQRQGTAAVVLGREVEMQL